MPKINRFWASFFQWFDTTKFIARIFFGIAVTTGILIATIFSQVIVISIAEYFRYDTQDGWFQLLTVAIWVFSILEIVIVLAYSFIKTWIELRNWALESGRDSK